MVETGLPSRRDWRRWSIRGAGSTSGIRPLRLGPAWFPRLVCQMAPSPSRPRTIWPKPATIVEVGDVAERRCWPIRRATALACPVVDTVGGPAGAGHGGDVDALLHCEDVHLAHQAGRQLRRRQGQPVHHRRERLVVPQHPLHQPPPRLAIPPSDGPGSSPRALPGPSRCKMPMPGASGAPEAVERARFLRAAQMQTWLGRAHVPGTEGRHATPIVRRHAVLPSLTSATAIDISTGRYSACTSGADSPPVSAAY